jgi:predicted Zn-dependent protease
VTDQIDPGTAVRGYFDELISWASSQLTGEEVLTASLSAEESDFVRFNRGEVRQAGSVQQRQLTIDLIEGSSHAEGGVQLSQDRALDQARVTTLLDQLRQQRALAPPDPFLAYATDAEAGSSEQVHPGTVPQPDLAIDRIRTAAAGHDLVGIYAAGNSYAGFANSLGQRNWFQSSTFNFDWSFYLRADKAVKNLYAGRHWDEQALAAKLSSSADQLAVLDRRPVVLEPGQYRTYLAPSAMVEVLDMMCWGGFSLESHRTKQTPLLHMATEGATLHPSVRMVEDTANGVAPNFERHGFVRPDEVVLIDGGRYHDWLVSPRSGIEYGVPTNGASPWEQPEALAMAGGALPGDEILGALDTGLYVGNLWYLNFSDRAACRTTGMTRFATFWVENGEIVAPAEVMRFDDTAYNMLGTNLVGLTEEAETILDPSTYESRSTGSYRIPGALIDDLAFTL